MVAGISTEKKILSLDLPKRNSTLISHLSFLIISKQTKKRVI